MPDIRDPNDPRHGTRAGYSAHRHVKDMPCGPCSQARTQYEREHGRPRWMKCATCGKSCRSVVGICGPCQRAMRDRDEPRAGMAGCTNCGRPTRSPGGICGPCRHYGNVELKDSDLLLDGWWVRKGLTLRWVAAA